MGVCLLFWDHINITHLTICNVLKPTCLTISHSGIFVSTDALIDKDHLWPWPLRCTIRGVWDWAKGGKDHPISGIDVDSCSANAVHTSWQVGCFLNWWRAQEAVLSCSDWATETETWHYQRWLLGFSIPVDLKDNEVLSSLTDQTGNKHLFHGRPCTLAWG